VRIQSGFTFVELAVTLAIMGVLATVAVPMVELVAQRQKERELRTALIQVREAIDAYKRATDQGRIPVKIGDSGYPKTLSDLVDGVVDVKTPQRQKMYFLRRVPRDPMHPDPSAAAVETWGKRSYASPPDAPHEGDDVFDVFSLSSAKGINGIPYKDW
jgi:general secretion pathway protein G